MLLQRRRRIAACLVFPILAAGYWLFFIRSNSNPDELLAKALKTIDHGDSQEARKLLDSVLERDPANATALLYRGQLAVERGNLDAALSDWRRIRYQPFQTG